MGKDLKGKELGVGLYQRADGRYEARAVIRGIKIDIYDTNLAELKKQFKEAKDKANNNIDVKLQSMTLDTWFTEWFDKYKKPYIKGSSIYPTVSRYNSTFGESLGNIKIKDIKNIDIQRVINDLISKGRASSSVRSALSTLKSCLDSAKNNRIIDINPSYDIMVPWSEVKASEKRFLSVEEQERFLKQVRSDFYKEMYYIMFHTGLRVGEVGGLTWDDVDFNSKCINITKSLTCNYEKGVKTCKLGSPKTDNSYRKIPFIGDTEAMFLSWREKQKRCRKELGKRWRSEGEFDNLVFTTSMGSPVTRYLVEKNINKIVEAINYEDAIEMSAQGKKFTPMESVYPHAIRHTFCSRCFESGMNPKVVQTLMGHANYSTTIDIYTHVTGGHIEDDILKFKYTDLTKEEE